MNAKIGSGGIALFLFLILPLPYVSLDLGYIDSKQIKQSAPIDNPRSLRSTDSSAQPKFWGIQLVVRNQLDWLLFWVIACIITFFSYQSFPLQKQESTLQLSEYLKGVSSCTEHDIICRHTRTHAISAASITLGLTLTQTRTRPRQVCAVGDFHSHPPPSSTTLFNRQAFYAF